MSAGRLDAAATRALLAAHGLAPKKTWGQSFLVDVGAQERIARAARLAPGDVAIEIGAGLGALTGHLLSRAGRVIAIERDPGLVAVLRARFAGHARLEIVAGDALAFDFAAAARAAGRAPVLLGNLPYQITSPLLFRFLGAAAGGGALARAVFMVQREFAERLVARPGTRAAGRLSVMAAQLAETRVLFHVGAGAFFPAPRVTSAVVEILPRVAPVAPVRDPAMFAAVVRAAFGARRKMLRGALAMAFGPTAEAALRGGGVDGKKRAEELPVAAFAAVADALSAAGARIPAASDPDADAPENEDGVA